MINYSKNENVNVCVGFRVCSRYCDLKSVGRSGLLTYRRNQSYRKKQNLNIVLC
jgi:hypothetical protein